MYSGVVAGRHQEVGEDTELVLSQLLLVLRPVVLVGSLEVLEDVLDGGGHGLGVVEVVGEDHEDIWEVWWDVVGAGVDEGTEAQHRGVPADQGCRLAALKGCQILLSPGLLPQLLGDLRLELSEELEGGLL